MALNQADSAYNIAKSGPTATLVSLAEKHPSRIVRTVAAIDNFLGLSAAKHEKAIQAEAAQSSEPAYAVQLSKPPKLSWPMRLAAAMFNGHSADIAATKRFEKNDMNGDSIRHDEDYKARDNSDVMQAVKMLRAAIKQETYSSPGLESSAVAPPKQRAAASPRANTPKADVGIPYNRNKPGNVAMVKVPDFAKRPETPRVSWMGAKVDTPDGYVEALRTVPIQDRSQLVKVMQILKADPEMAREIGARRAFIQESETLPGLHYLAISAAPSEQPALFAKVEAALSKAASSPAAPSPAARTAPASQTPKSANM